MKKEYLQGLPKPTDIKNEAYNAYLDSVQQIFTRIQKNYELQQSQYLLEEIKKLKEVRELKKAHKKPIYEFFLKRQLQTLSYIKGENTIDYEIIKLTKTKVDGLKLNWKDIWEKILKQVPQSSSSSAKWIQNFIKHIKVYFDENNPLQVWEYFQSQNFKDISKMIHLFARITSKTNQNIFNDFLTTLVKNCKVQRISNNEFLVLFLWLQKSRKQLNLPKQVFQFVNDLVLEFILANNDKNSKKGTVQNNFNAGSAELLQKTLGKSNPGSLELLKIIFSFIKKFIKPLENSSKSVMFVYWLFKSIFQRVQAEKKTKEKLIKLAQKINKKKQEQEQQIQQKLETTQQQKKQNLKKQELEDNDEEEQEEEEQVQEQQDEELQQMIMLGQASKISFEKDDQINEKDDNEDEQREKLQKLLVNELSQQILDYLEKEIDEIFEIIYFVNSKKTISYLLRYIFRLFPKFVLKSIDLLDKAANIPNISEDGLVKNLTVTVEHMFVSQNYKDGIKNVMRVIQKANNSRRIVDVWYIYESLVSKIPLLDEKDLQAIPSEDKQLFEKTFEINHDRFYQQYSDHMVQAFKRLVKQGQYLEKGQYKSYAITMEQTYHNSYPFMKKRILSEVMEVISQKPNSLALFYFAFFQLPSKQYEILKNNFISINEQNKDSEQLRLQMLGVLSQGMSLDELKPYVRKMAEKSHFRLIQDYAVYRCFQSIKWQPYKTTLNYFYEDPKLQIQFQNSLQKRKTCLKQLQVYRGQLLDEAMKLMDQIKEDQPDSVPQRVIKSYTTTPKILTFIQRKKIYEIFSIVSVINFMMEQKLVQIKNSKKLELVNSDVSPYGFLNVDHPFSKYIKKILKSQQVLHDPKLISIINKLLTDEFFMYLDIQINEDKKLSKEKKRNKNHEAPDYVNRITYGNQYIALSRSYMALLLHKTNGGAKFDIKGKTDELFILSLVHSNQAYKDLRSMFQQSKLINLYRDHLISTMKFKVQNRDLIKRIASAIDFLTKKENLLWNFSDQQILDFVSYHATLIQCNDSKVKENAIKSFRKFANIIYEHPISDSLTQSMLKYRHTQKLEMIWIIYTAALIHHSKFVQQKARTQKRVFYLLTHTEQLILHESRSIRRASLYIYPSLIRILKKLNEKYQTRNFQLQEYKNKELSEFIETGFLKPQFYDKDLKEKSMHKRHPQNTYKFKQVYEVPSHLLDFLIEHPEKSIKFVKTFHSDLASSAEMMISAMQSAMSTVDLFGIANKAIEKLIYFYKTSDMAISRSQILVGAKFFKYLCLEDSKRGYKFFQASKDFILNCLSNMESLDNHNLVILYSYSLINAYETNFKQRIPEIEEFLAKIFRQVIKKSSKIIYTKLQTLFFKKIKNKQAIKFIEEMCEEMISQNNRIFRTGYLLATINGKSYQTSERLLRKMFDEKLELQHESNISSTLTFLLTFPQYERWSREDIEKTNIIDLAKLKQQNKVEEVQRSFVMFLNKDLQVYLVKTLKQLLEGQSIEMSKTSFTILNNLIKLCGQLYMSEQNSNFVVDLLTVWLKMLKQRTELQLDYESGYRAIGSLLGSNILSKNIFQKFLIVILDSLESNKKSCDLLIQILNSPINYLQISNALLEKFVKKILDFENNSPIYKQLLQILSTLFRYRLEPFEKLNQLEKDNKNRRSLLLQAYLLAENADLKPQIVKQVLKVSLKERKNIWAREMKLVRGQRQYFDKQETYQIWKEIKQLSNTYNYHA